MPRGGGASAQLQVAAQAQVQRVNHSAAGRAIFRDLGSRGMRHTWVPTCRRPLAPGSADRSAALASCPANAVVLGPRPWIWVPGRLARGGQVFQSHCPQKSLPVAPLSHLLFREISKPEVGVGMAVGLDCGAGPWGPITCTSLLPPARGAAVQRDSLRTCTPSPPAGSPLPC